ncbi:BTAD domain-containing putative transcriptional regulator [Actinosynnema sp. NPDC047251]|uniref:AfsR/SARP family transcriptional regulator n=1 Tax=Saccharothrix espanaensis TaxID=103731 RepID=UPI0003064161|nr:AfsR/SARP family transcriptional regulator [Saccharothrix espanaensis]
MEFRLLGPFEVVADGRVITLNRRRERFLLAVLALHHNRPVSAERLVDLASDGAPTTAAEAALRSNVSRLRSALPPELGRVERRGTGYALVTDPERIDVHRFRGLVARARDADPAGRADLLRDALALWRGPVLADVASDLARQRLVQGLEEARLDALEQRVAADLELGRPVVAELRDLVAEHPSRERFAALLVLALHRSGEQVRALAVYDERRRWLRAEHGLDPGADLRAAHREVLRAEARPAGRTFLPYDVPDFTGRAAEIARLAGTTGIALVDGMAGVGKTALALHVAHRLANRFPDGRLFVDLHAHTAGREPVDPADALEVLLREAGVPADGVPASVDARSALWRSTLAGRRVLVVLDNAAGAEQVRPLLPGTAGCLVLVTSRRRLATIAGATPLSLDVLPEADAVALFDRVATRAEPAEVAEVVALCGRLPLAIRIAAARLQHRPLWTVAQLRDRLRDRLRELSVDDHGVAAAFSLSYRQLDDAHQRVFRLVGAQPGVDVDVFAAAAAAGLPPDRAEVLLEGLLDVHLLEQRAPGRYTFHDLIREYARAVTVAEERAEATHRLFDYYLRATDRANRLLVPDLETEPPVPAFPDAGLPPLADHVAAGAWCERERPNLLAAIRHAEDLGLPAYTWLISRSLARHLLVGGHLHDGIAAHTAAADAARRAGDAEAHLVASINLATNHWLSDRYRPALEGLTGALELARAAGDRAREVFALNRLAALRHCLGEDGGECARQALAGAVELGKPREESFALWVLSLIAWDAGDVRGSLEHAAAMLAVSRATGDAMWETAALVRVGRAESALHGYRPDRFAAAVAAARSIADHHHEAEALVEWADAGREACPSQARALAEQAHDLVRRGSRPSLTGVVHAVLAAVHARAGEVGQAREHAARARSIAGAIGHRRLADRVAASVPVDTPLEDLVR